MVEQRVAVPDVTITASAVETWGEPQIAVGDTATATVTFQVTTQLLLLNCLLHSNTACIY
jgi:hypothetical protein